MSEAQNNEVIGAGHSPAPIVFETHTRKEQMQEITDKLEQGVKEIFESDQFKEYLSTMSKFYDYSINNSMLIFLQKPDASHVAGFRAWEKKFDRHVIKGQKGLKIIAPTKFKVLEKENKTDPKTGKPVIGSDGKPVKETVEKEMIGYHTVTVFDVSQTYGKELPEIPMSMLSGKVPNYKRFFDALKKVSPVPIDFETIEGSANGYYSFADKRIAIKKDMSEAQTIKTTIHEISHAKLHDLDLKTTEDKQKLPYDKQTREVQAESVSYCVCQHYGLDTSSYSFGYVAGWSSGKETAELKASLNVIRKTAAEIITDVDAQIATLNMEQTQESEKAPGLIENKDTFSIYQLTDKATEKYGFISLNSLRADGVAVDPANYRYLYNGEFPKDKTLEDIYVRFNLYRPENFIGHSLSVSDVIVTQRDGMEKAYYVDRFGFTEVPDFMTLLQEQRQTPINPLETAEKSTEQNYNMIDGQINNTPTVDELEKRAKAGETISITEIIKANKADKARAASKDEKRPSIRAQLKKDKQSVARGERPAQQPKQNNKEREV